MALEHQQCADLVRQHTQHQYAAVSSAAAQRLMRIYESMELSTDAQIGEVIQTCQAAEGVWSSAGALGRLLSADGWFDQVANLSQW